MTPIYDAMVRSHGHNPAPDISDQALARIVAGTPTPIPPDHDLLGQWAARTLQEATDEHR
jgi:fructose-1-phosphate kinase PfkB-like protein